MRHVIEALGAVSGPGAFLEVGRRVEGLAQLLAPPPTLQHQRRVPRITTMSAATITSAHRGCGSGSGRNGVSHQLDRKADGARHVIAARCFLRLTLHSTDTRETWSGYRRLRGRFAGWASGLSPESAGHLGVLSCKGSGAANAGPPR